MFDDARVRGLYTGLGQGWVYFDSSKRSLVPERVSTTSSMAFRKASLVSPRAQQNLLSATAENPVGILQGTEYLGEARKAVAKFMNVTPDCVFFGASRQQLLSSLAFGLTQHMGLGREVVLSRLDDPENIVPWEAIARHYAATVKWAEVELTTGVLPAWQYTNLVNSNTGVVAVTAAHSGMGTVVDIPTIASIVRKQSPGAWLVVDGSTYGSYRAIDIQHWDADVVVMDLAQSGGPEVSVMVFKDYNQLYKLNYPFLDKSRHGSSTELPERIARTLEMGGVAPALLAAVPTWLDYWTHLDDSVRGHGRERLEVSMHGACVHASALADKLRNDLQGLESVYVLGEQVEDYFDDSDDEGETPERLPRVSFMIPNVNAATIQERLVSNKIVVETIQGGESQLYDLMGVSEQGGAVVAGISAFNTLEDVEHLVRSMGSLS